MKRAAARWLFWLLLLAYIGVSIWWTLIIPRDTDQLLRAIPGQAMAVTMHDRLADRWLEVSAHPVAASLASVFGVEPDAWEATRRDPGLAYILDLVGRDQLVMAYVPYLDYQREPSWVMASWVGGRSHRLRWMLPYLKIPGLERTGQMGGWPVWTYRWTTDGVAHQITLALVEGMILGCQARNPLAMEMIIEAYNGTFPSIRRRADLRDVNERLLRSRHPDRLWYKSMNPRGNATLDDPWMFELDLRSNTTVAGTARLTSPMGLDTIPPEVEIAELFDLWRAHPIAYSVLSADLFDTDVLDTNTVTGRLITDVVEAAGGEALAWGLFGGDFSGRYKGIKVPTIMAGVAMDEARDAGELARALADRWNARDRWGLVVVEEKAGEHAVYRFEGTSGSLYAGLSASEQVAMTRTGSWLVVSSNAKGLIELLSRPDAGGEALMATDPAGDQWGYLGMDLVRGGETLRLALSAYSLKLLFEDAEGSRATRQQLNEAKAWLDVLARLQYLRLSGRRTAAFIEVDFQTGP